MTSPILWQNTAQTVALLDIPRSISAAQGSIQHPCHGLLLSSKPLDVPFPIQEPKTAAARANLEANTVDAALAGVYHALLDDALGQIRENHEGEWCLPRPFVEDPKPKVGKKRKLDIDELPNEVEALPHDAHAARRTLPSDVFKELSSVSTAKGWYLGTAPEEPEAVDDHSLTSATHDPHFRPAYREETMRLIARNRHLPVTYGFRIPPRASFYLSSVAESRAFHAAIRAQAQEDSTPRHFNCILLDPPWPNRSVTRTHQTAGSTYTIAPTLRSVQKLILGMDLEMVMGEDCLVGIWITNKPAIRNLVLGEGGLFDCWGVELTEEWVWLKTTIHGEPVTRIASAWRKPYEVLLLGSRKRNLYEDNPTGMQQPKRRVLVAVPDLHSRKPCLKELIEPLLSSLEGETRVLEVFARHLVAGWWSWGDECIKFNWEGCWHASALNGPDRVGSSPAVISTP